MCNFSSVPSSDSMGWQGSLGTNWNWKKLWEFWFCRRFHCPSKCWTLPTGSISLSCVPCPCLLSIYMLRNKNEKSQSQRDIYNMFRINVYITLEYPLICLFSTLIRTLKFNIFDDLLILSHFHFMKDEAPHLVNPLVESFVARHAKSSSTISSS